LKKQKREAANTQRQWHMKVNVNAGSSTCFLRTKDFKKIWQAYWVGFGSNPAYRYLERAEFGSKTKTWRLDIQRYEAGAHDKAGQKKHSRATWWYDHQVYFNCFEFLVAATDNGWDDDKKKSGAGAGLNMADAEALAQQMWQGCKGTTAVAKRKEFKEKFQLKLGEYHVNTWLLHGKAYDSLFHSAMEIKNSYSINFNLPNLYFMIREH
jgi:hypothetical protein